MHSPRHVGADVLSLSFNVVDDGVDLFVGERIHPSELSMKVGRVFRHFTLRIGDLVVKSDGLLVEVLHRDPCLVPERHRPIGVEGAPRVHADGHGRNPRVLPPAYGEEVADGNFYRRLFFVIPVHSENRVSPIAGRRHPDVFDRARSIDLAHGESRPRLNEDVGIHLPSLPQFAGLARRGALNRHATFAFFAGQILGAYRECFRVGETI